MYEGSLYIRVNTILNHIDTRVILLRYEGMWMLYRIEPNGIQKMYILKHPFPTCIKKRNILIIRAQVVLK